MALLVRLVTNCCVYSRQYVRRASRGEEEIPCGQPEGRLTIILESAKHVVIIYLSGSSIGPRLKLYCFFGFRLKSKVRFCAG